TPMAPLLSISQPFQKPGASRRNGGRKSAMTNETSLLETTPEVTTRKKISTTAMRKPMTMTISMFTPAS
ncbi:Hypothetical Protein FCC1311_006292, partial [Hondaea fermentalgiana]